MRSTGLHVDMTVQFFLAEPHLHDLSPTSSDKDIYRSMNKMRKKNCNLLTVLTTKVHSLPYK